MKSAYTKSMESAVLFPHYLLKSHMFSVYFLVYLMHTFVTITHSFIVYFYLLSDGIGYEIGSLEKQKIFKQRQI